MMRRMTQLATGLLLGSILILAGCSGAETGGVQPDETATSESTTASEPTAPSTSEDAAPSLSEVESVLMDFAEDNSAQGTAASIDDIRMAVDGQGRWWVSAMVIAEQSANTDDAQIYAYKNGEQWVLAFGPGTNSLDLDLPEEVVDQLAPRR